MQADKPSTLTTDMRAERAKLGCWERPRRPIDGYSDPDDPVWCWCGFEIVMGIGQCNECQEAEGMYAC